MDGRLVLDASTFGAAVFNEEASPPARRLLRSGATFIAPDLLFAEIASLSAKKVWRAEASAEAGQRALSALHDFVDEFVSLGELAPRAFELAARHKFSAYDGIYLALAERRGTRLATLDEKLVTRATAANLGEFVLRPE